MPGRWFRSRPARWSELAWGSQSGSASARGTEAVAEGLAVGVAGSATMIRRVSDAALDDDSSVAPVGAGWP